MNYVKILLRKWRLKWQILFKEIGMRITIEDVSIAVRQDILREIVGYRKNIRQDTRNNTCHECGKLGHKARECYRNRTCQRCGKKGHTQEVCRNTISRLNYTEEWDNDDEFYDYEEDEAYVTLRSGRKTHTPEIARRLQDQGHQKPKPMVIQGGQYHEEFQKPRQPNKVIGRKKMDVDGE